MFVIMALMSFFLERVAAVNRGHHTFLPGRKHGALWTLAGLGIGWVYLAVTATGYLLDEAGIASPVVGGAWFAFGNRHFLTDSRRGSDGSSWGWNFDRADIQAPGKCLPFSRPAC